MSRERGKLVLIGCGGVGSALLEIMPLNGISFANILIIEPRDLSNEPILKTVPHVHLRIEVTEKNLISILEQNVKKKDIIVDASYNIYFKPLIQWCLDHQVKYVNTSLEKWPTSDEHLLEGESSDLYKRTLHYFHHTLQGIDVENGPTVVVEHGMNPGLITHFAKLGILHLAEDVMEKISPDIDPKLEEAYANDDFATLAYLLEIETIHCSERDTQIPLEKRKKGEFMNTWGPYSLYGEGVDPVQLGYGTHEIKAEEVKGAIIPRAGKRNQLILPIRGAYAYGRSYVPHVGHIRGMLIPHGENDTISRMLTLYSGKNVKYRPSNYYVYSPADVAWESMAEVKSHKYHMLPIQKALRGYQIKSGFDAVGCLFIMASDPVKRLSTGVITKPVSWWCGTILDLKETRRLGIKYAGPTTVQVAISICSVLKWMVKHPKNGVCFPEDLPFEEILNNSKPFLGEIFSGYVPFHPASTRFEDICCE